MLRKKLVKDICLGQLLQHISCFERSTHMNVLEWQSILNYDLGTYFCLVIYHSKFVLAGTIKISCCSVDQCTKFMVKFLCTVRLASIFSFQWKFWWLLEKQMWRIRICKGWKRFLEKSPLFDTSVEVTWYQWEKKLMTSGKEQLQKVQMSGKAFFTMT